MIGPQYPISCTQQSDLVDGAGYITRTCILDIWDQSSCILGYAQVVYSSRHVLVACNLLFCHYFQTSFFNLSDIYFPSKSLFFLFKIHIIENMFLIYKWEKVRDIRL